MANAIHKSEVGETLASIAASYFALDMGDGTQDDVRLAVVVQGIRGATPTSVTDLTSVGDTDILSTGSTVFVPTIRVVHRVVYADNASLESDLDDLGLHHADKLVEFSAEQLHAEVSGHTLGDVERALVLTQFLNLDGMDLYAAKYLYDTEGIESLEELAEQSVVTLAGFLTTLQGAPHNRPSEIGAQGHEKRWRVEARLTVPRSPNPGSAARVFSVPFSSTQSRAQAEYFEKAATAEEETSQEEETLAVALGHLYRFQEGVLAGHEASLSGRPVVAATAYQGARAAYHRLAEHLNVVADVDDSDGMNMDQCTETAAAMLAILPSNDPSPLGAPAVRSSFSVGRRGYSLKAFTYEELEDAGIDRKAEFRTAIGSVAFHRLPRRMRKASLRAISGKSHADLNAASSGLVSGVTSAPTNAIGRDFEPVDKTRFLRNLGGSNTSVLFGSGGGLDLMDQVGPSTPLGDVGGLVGSLWDTNKADDVLSTSAKASYPSTGFLSRGDVKPFTSFVVLPGLSGDAQDRYLPVTTNTANEIRDGVVKPMLLSKKGQDLSVPAAVWEDPGAFCAMSPFIYCFLIPLGLGLAYSRQGSPKLRDKFGGIRVDTWSADGTTHVRDVAAVLPGSITLRPDLTACSTDWDPDDVSALLSLQIQSYAQWRLEEARYKHKRGDLAGARAAYLDVTCAIERADPSVADEARIALAAVNAEMNGTESVAPVGPFADLVNSPFLRVQYETGGSTKTVGQDWSVAGQFRSPVPTQSPKIATGSWYEWYGVPSATNLTVEPGLDLSPSQAVVDLGDLTASTSEAAAIRMQLFGFYTVCASSAAAIDAGINEHGFHRDYVPPWTFDHLYAEARNLADRALGAERRMESLLQLLEAAERLEYQSGQATAVAEEAITVAEAEQSAAFAAGCLSVSQANLTKLQYDQQAELSDVVPEVLGATEVWADTAAGEGKGPFNMDPLGEDYGATVATVSIATSQISAAIGLVPGAGSIGGMTDAMGNTAARALQHVNDLELAANAHVIAGETQAASVAANTAAVARTEFARLQAQQARDYASFLDGQLLNADGFAQLLQLASQVHEGYLGAAARMAWLAQRALENQTLRPFSYMKGPYVREASSVASFVLEDLTIAERLTQHLELMRADYKQNQSFRFQEVKWTVRLGDVAPNARVDLQSRGECVIAVRQEDIDSAFPGTFLHQLKDIRVEVIGLVPARGVKGVLMCNGIYQTRVPNSELYSADDVAEDWVTGALSGTSQSLAGYQDYVLRNVVGPFAALQLSEFETGADRVVLTSPEGMLKPVEHIGLNTSWTLTLPQTANPFEFSDIMDLEITFWFRCAFDRRLMLAMQQAWQQRGEDGELMETHKCSFRPGRPSAWNVFSAPPMDLEALDLRRMSWDFDSLPSWKTESSLSLVELLAGIARIEQKAEATTHDFTLRVLCDLDPVGIELNFDETGAIRTAATVSGETGDAGLESWLTELQAAGPNPMGRWVVKAQPSKVGAGWLAAEMDGSLAETTSGALEGDSTGGSAMLSYDDGGAWTDCMFAVKLATGGASLRLRLRDDGTDHYACEFSENAGKQELKLFRVEGGVDSQLGSTVQLSKIYPNDEFLDVLFVVRGDKLSLIVDGITLMDDVDGVPPAGKLLAGSIGLAVLSGGTASFDDARVVELSSTGATLGRLLEEGFTGALPSDWTASGSWAVSTSPHGRMDFTGLVNVSLNLEYSFGVDFSGGAS